ncbi:response regulator [Paenibacillus nanensis]|uniref:Response regulator n=1 Tax=Paenibacillus nanensis TaxID=393251 RepID=A0A3A1UXE4_9BACL|nr:RICIN domain-containing protein [Paenibacillus nanensis]RIX53199.1 response regulator [Paenibacillus nanensis]
MLKAMIVEDNAIYRYAIKTIIDWERCGFELAAEAVNGRQALERLVDCPVDLIVTDISMPEMNGIDLIHSVKQSAPETKVIVLSSYDDFHFVKDALKLGALDYLLKHDLEEEGLIQAVTQAREKIEEERSRRSDDRPQQRQAALQLLREALLSSEDANDLGRRGEAADAALRESSIVLLAVSMDAAACKNIASLEAVFGSAIGQMTDVWQCVTLAPHRVAVALDFGRERSEARLAGAAHQAAERIKASLDGMGIACSIGISRAGLGLKAARGLLAQAEAALFRSIYAERESSRIFAPLTEQGQPEPDLGGSVSSLSKALKNGSAESIELHARRLFQDMRRMKPGKGVVRKVLLDLFAQLVVLASDRGVECEPMEHWHDRIARALDRLEDIKTIQSLFLEQCLRLTGGQPHGERTEIRLAREYILARLGEDLNVADIAARLGLSPNYLSVIFRQQTGQRLVEFIQHSRVEAAKKLLRETTLKVYEVAERVGFKDTSYFCKVFKEYAAMTVSDFRCYGQPAGGFLPEADYLLVNRGSGMALDVQGEAREAGAELIQYHPHGGKNQLWRLLPAGDGVFKLVNRWSGLLLDVEGASANAGARLVQAADHGGESQRWSVVKAGSYFKLVNIGSGLRADVNGCSKEAHAPVIQWKDNHGANQQWSIVNAHSAGIVKFSYIS